MSFPKSLPAPLLRRAAFGLWSALCLVGAASAADDGVVLIDQARALAGGVTPGDEPGFPVRITRAGSYRLAGNLAVADPSTAAISIEAENVTLDLAGFTIAGPLTCQRDSMLGYVCSPKSNGGSGVRAAAANTTVHNGMVRGFGAGVHGEHANMRVERMNISHTRSGVRVGDHGIVADNIVTLAAYWAVDLPHSAVARGNMLSSSRVGINIAGGSPLVERNTLFGNDWAINAGGFGPTLAWNNLTGSRVADFGASRGIQFAPNLCSNLQPCP